MRIKYSILFTIEILHDYYTEGECRDFEVVATEETISTLWGHRMLYKTMGNKLIVLVETDADGKPVANFDSFKKIDFYLRLSNNSFYNFSNVEYRSYSSEKYYFSNVNQNKIGTSLYLSSKIANYNSFEEYPIGAFAANGINEVFEAIKPSSSGSAHALNETDFWHKRGKLQYVNKEDLMEVSSFVFQFATPPAIHFTIKVFGENEETGNYDLQVLDTVNLDFSEPQSSVPVRLEKLQKGKYRIEVNGASKLVYLDKDALYNNVFGIIEISNLLSSSNHFSLFNAAGKPKQALFSLRFANRLMFWKYLSKTGDITAVSDSRNLPDKIEFTAEPENQFVSSKPVPLSEKPVNTLSIESSSLGNISPIANPGIKQPGSVVKDGHTYYCAEIYLNY